ncbi:complex I subunit 5 family protein [Halobacteriovorax sp. ZH4_bin.1]|uniref:complex I subunit 5 family protein n=1 Tax=unclassified Halobacteriovorax TaxID=2639665 RepID=UPI00371F88A1
MIYKYFFIIFLILPLLSASFTLLFKDSDGLGLFFSNLFSLLYFIYAGICLFSYTDTSTFVAGDWESGIGISLSYDLFSGIMIFVIGAIYFTGALYAYPGVTVEKKSTYHFLYNTLFLGLTGAFLTRDLFNLFVWFEITLMSSYVLVVLDSSRKRLKSGLKYILLNFISGLIFLISIALIYKFTNTLDFKVLNERLSQLYTSDAGLVRSLALSLFGAFAIKSAFFPLFFWLPESYPKLSAGLSGVLAGLLTKLGLYAMIRVFGQVFPPDLQLFWTVLILAIVTLLVGVWFAVVQNKLREILSYHIISQVGFIGIGVSFCLHPDMALRKFGLTSALFYIFHHIIVKTNLFFVSGLVRNFAYTEKITKLGGLLKTSPTIALLFMIPAASLIGIPPFSGFWAKLGLFKIATESRLIWIIIPMIIGSFFTLYSMVKIWSGVFWGEYHEFIVSFPKVAIVRSYISCILLCLFTLIISLNPLLIFKLAQEVGKIGLVYK